MSSYDEIPADEPRMIDLTIGSLIGDEVVTIGPEATVRAAAARMDEAQVSLIVVGGSDDVQGVVSERDIVRAVATGVDVDVKLVGDVGSTRLRWATPESTISEVIDEMMTSYVRHVLVGNDGGTLAGVLSMRDLVAVLDR